MIDAILAILAIAAVLMFAYYAVIGVGLLVVWAVCFLHELYKRFT